MQAIPVRQKFRLQRSVCSGFLLFPDDVYVDRAQIVDVRRAALTLSAQAPPNCCFPVKGSQSEESRLKERGQGVKAACFTKLINRGGCTRAQHNLNEDNLELWIIRSISIIVEECRYDTGCANASLDRLARLCYKSFLAPVGFQCPLWLDTC